MTFFYEWRTWDGAVQPLEAPRNARCSEPGNYAHLFTRHGILLCGYDGVRDSLQGKETRAPDADTQHCQYCHALEQEIKEDANAK